MDMQDFLSNNWKEVLIALIAIFAGIAITIRIRSKKTTQNRNFVGGDMAGRDINKGNKK